MFVCCECCLLSGRSLSYGLIPRTEKSYQARARVCVCVCVIELQQ